LASRLNTALDQSDPASRTTVATLTAELKAQVSRRLAGRWTQPPRWLEQARSIVRDDTNAGVCQIADRVGVHRVHLARAFRDHYGASVSVYARQVRLARAQRLLCTTHLPLSRVAFEAGFADQAHLTRVLRRATGTTPGTLRRTALHGFNTTSHAAG
jgi:AraC family transcriptional regulator